MNKREIEIKKRILQAIQDDPEMRMLVDRMQALTEARGAIEKSKFSYTPPFQGSNRPVTWKELELVIGRKSIQAITNV